MGAWLENRRVAAPLPAPPTLRESAPLCSALLLCVLLSAGCRPPLPGAAAREADSAAALTSHGRPTDSPDEPSLDVQIDALFAGASPPGVPGRNPFRFERAAPPTMLEDAVSGGNPAVAPGAVDGWRPADDPAAIRFLGVVEAPESIGRVAVLRDGSGVYHGRVNDVVGGRYRIVALDRTAIVIERVGDGERRTLRPSGY